MTPRSAAGIAVALVTVGLLIRLPGLADPPLDFHPTRQYRAAIIARGYSLDLLGGLSEAERQAAEAAVRAQVRIEPPVMERLASWVYHIIGREDLAWGRALAVIAWSLGGLATFWLAAQVLAAPAALVSVAVWMFLPFAIRASQSFQPDPLMTALVVFTLAAGLKYRRGRTIGRGVVFGCALAAALAVKAMSVFFTGPAILALLLFGNGSVRGKAQALGITILASIPAAWYYTTLPLATDYGPFFQLLRQPQFWRDWAMILGRVVSWPLLIAAVVGTLVARGEVRRLLLALFAGYVAFGIVFTGHIHTHDYYSLPLVPVVALGVGALIDRLSNVWPGRWSDGLAAVVTLGCLVMGSVAVLDSQRSERKASLEAEVARYQRIGRLVGHSTRVLALDGSYGLPLAYHGYMLTANWPLGIDLALLSLTGGSVGSAEERLKAMGGDFFVGTLQPELDGQPDLQRALESRHPLIERDGAPEHWAYVVYDLRRDIVSATPAHLSMFTHVGAPAPAPEESVSLYASAAATWAVHVPEGSGLTIQPAEGTGPATLRVTTAVPLSEEDRTVKVSVSSPTDGSAAFDVRIRAVAGPDLPPFGFVDMPPDPVTLERDPVLFQGWALDDTSMKRVWVGYVDPSGRVMSLGDATRQGRRPDVAAHFPTAHDLYKAGWAFTLNPSAVRHLPRPIQLQFIAEDGHGKHAEIGRRTLR
jgi:hypothetical protein